MSDPSVPPGKPPLSLGRRIAAAIGVIAVVLTGACTLSVWGDPYVGGPIVLLFGGIPFLVGLYVVIAAIRFGR